MNKVLALLRNEWTKTLKNKIVYIMMGLIIVGILSLGGIFRISRNAPYQQPQNGFSEVKSVIENDLKNINADIQIHEDRLNNKAKKEDSADSTEVLGDSKEITASEKQLKSLYTTKTYYELALAKEINIFNPDYHGDAVHKLAELIQIKQNANNQLSNDIDLTEFDKNIEQLENALNQNNYADYINFQIGNIEKNENLTEQQKSHKISDLKLRLELNPKGYLNYGAKNFYDSLIFVRDINLSSIAKGYADFTPLTSSEIKNAEKDYLIADYYISRPSANIPESNTTGNYFPYTAVAAGTYGMIVLIIILAGSTISQEISSGSIKGLIIAPVKRQKIFYAKLINIFCVSLVGMLIVFFTTLISSYLFIEKFYLLPYAYYSGSAIKVLSFPVYLLILSLTKTSYVIISGLIALMFSSTTKNTSIAVGISMVSQFGILSIYNFFKIILGQKHILMSFLPFNYLDLSPYILPTIYGVTGDTMFVTGSSIIKDFTLDIPSGLPYIYWILMSFCLIWIARDSFVKRDL